MSLRIWHLWCSTVFGLKRLIKVKYLSVINEIYQLSKISLNICINSRSYLINLVISITLQGSSFPVLCIDISVSIEINGHSFKNRAAPQMPNYETHG